MGRTKIKRRWGVWGWTWRGLLCLAALVFVAFALLLAAALIYDHRRSEVMALPQRQYNLVVYDAVVAAIKTRYYDATFGGGDWLQQAAKARPLAAAAPNAEALYHTVLMPLLARLPVSHVQITMPEGPRKGIDMGSAPLLTGCVDAGAEIVPIRRNKALVNVIGDVVRGSPAERAGLQPGWGVSDWQTQFTYDKAAGWRGRTHLTYLPIYVDHMKIASVAGTNRISAVGRDATTVKAVTVDLDSKAGPCPDPFAVRRLAGGALYVRTDSFDEGGIGHVQTDRLMAAIDGADGRGIVLDLRHNRGGRIDQTNRTLSRFLPPWTTTGFQMGRKGRRTWRTWPALRPYKGPVVVLIGPATGSGGEVVASVLKSYRRAVVIGRTSNGSVLASKTATLPDYGHLQIAISDYLTPDGQHIESNGVRPDIEVIPTLEDIRAGRDIAVMRAEQALVGRS